MLKAYDIFLRSTLSGQVTNAQRSMATSDTHEARAPHNCLLYANTSIYYMPSEMNPECSASFCTNPPDASPFEFINYIVSTDTVDKRIEYAKRVRG